MKRLTTAGLMLGLLAGASPVSACMEEHTTGSEREFHPSYRIEEPAYSPEESETHPERFAYGGGAVALLCAAVVGKKNGRTKG